MRATGLSKSGCGCGCGGNGQQRGLGQTTPARMYVVRPREGTTVETAIRALVGMNFGGAGTVEVGTPAPIAPDLVLTFDTETAPLQTILQVPGVLGVARTTEDELSEMIQQGARLPQDRFSKSESQLPPPEPSGGTVDEVADYVGGNTRATQVFVALGVGWLLGKIF